MWKLVVFAVALALGGCAHRVAWMRADGAVADPTQKQLAITICQGEMQKADMGYTGRMGMLSTARAQNDIFAGCMAEKGYVGMSLD